MTLDQFSRWEISAKITCIILMPNELNLMISLIIPVKIMVLL